MVIEYVVTILEKAMDTATFRGKLKFEDLIWQVVDVRRSFTRIVFLFTD